VGDQPVRRVVIPQQAEPQPQHRLVHRDVEPLELTEPVFDHVDVLSLEVAGVPLQRGEHGQAEETAQSDAMDARVLHCASRYWPVRVPRKATIKRVSSASTSWPSW